MAFMLQHRYNVCFKTVITSYSMVYTTDQQCIVTMQSPSLYV